MKWHIKRDPSPQESHHYNRAWSKVLERATIAHRVRALFEQA